MEILFSLAVLNLSFILCSVFKILQPGLSAKPLGLSPVPQTSLAPCKVENPIQVLLYLLQNHIWLSPTLPVWPVHTLHTLTIPPLLWRHENFPPVFFQSQTARSESFLSLSCRCVELSPLLNPTLSNLCSFKSHLKTHFFKQYFD